jgi:nicotinate-nucleotide adenylyltransferase
MNIGLFGGTFDPSHKGHLALALSARERCGLGRIYFVPTNVPPHKTAQPVASYFHRYAMTALATQTEKTFLPSLLEAPGEFILHDKKSARGSVASAPNYSIDTIRRLKQSLKKSDRVFFLIGVDAFKDIAKWREAETLFAECAFIVASRPGFSLADIATALPEKLRPRA